MKIWQRLALFILVFIAVSFLPWWLSAISLAFLVIFIHFYIEALFFGFLFDILYSNGHIGLVSALIFVLLIEGIKTRIRI